MTYRLSVPGTLKLALLLAALAGPSAAHAQTSRPAAGFVAPACAALGDRLARQKRINAAFQCDLRTRPRGAALRRCRPVDRTRLRTAAASRAVVLERCIARRLAADADRAATTAENPPNRLPRQTVRRPATDNAAARDSGQRLKDLLASGPIFDRDAAADGALPRARTFRSGLMWSYAGPIAGMSCVQWREPSDPHKWDDNYLCSERDVGFQWSFRGPILGRGLKCIQVQEKSDPHDWHDNFFCWPRDLAINFRFSSTGRIAGMRCLAIIEPSDPHTWRDNYLCHERQVR